MGRLIDADALIQYWLTPPMNVGWDDAIEDVNNQPTVEAIPKADYENRLKADMVSMLTDIQLEIEELQGKYSPYYDEASQHISEVIQQKIEQLKENKKH